MEQTMSTAIAEFTPYLSPTAAAVARTRDLTKRYGNVTALHNVNIELRAGELLALLGPNGAGKTTLVRMLLGLAKSDAGSVSVFGADPRSLAVRSRCGAMLQVGRVPETLKVREHIDLFSSYYPKPLPLAETLQDRRPGGDQRPSASASSPADRNSACCSASPSAAIPTCCFSTSRPSGWTWRRAA